MILFRSLPILAVLAALAASSTGQAQTLPASQPRFEVASIYPSDLATNDNRLNVTPEGGLRAENVTVESLIALAYDLLPFQLADGPDWLRSQRFTINATPDRPATADHPVNREEISQRTRSLLKERFGLELHAETRDMPVYALVVAKGDSKLTVSAPGSSMHFESNPGGIHATAADMESLARSLSKMLGRLVVNKTGLPGSYNFQLEWAPETSSAGPVADAGPSLFTAVQEQLGLRLESQKAPVPVLVVAQVHLPSAN